MISLDEVKKLISSDGTRQTLLSRQAAYVKGNNPSILAPRPKEEPDNRIPIPFARRAILFYLGYMFKEGNIVYSGDGFDDRLQGIFEANDEGLVTHQAATNALTHGVGYELHWAVGGEDQFAIVPTNQSIPIFDKTLKPRMVGFIRHWFERDPVDNKVTFYAHVYDESKVIRYTGPSIQGLIEESQEAHGYGRVPVVEFIINPAKENLFDHVAEIIDFLDKILSENYANELSKLSEAILAMAGRIDDTPDAHGVTDVDRIKMSGIMQNVGDGSKAVTDFIAYITKNINPAFLESGYDRSYDLVYEMLPLPNPKETTNGDVSGVAHKFRILAFEYACATYAAYFSIGLQDRIALIKKLDTNLGAKIVEGVKKFLGIGRKNTDVTITWNRNLPDDIPEIVHTAATAQGILSRETILKLFPTYIVEDVDEELKRLEDEGGSAISMFGETGEMQGEDVQATALNGAQVTSLQGIAQAVASGELPYATAMELVQVAFPTIDKATATRMLKPAESFEPESLQQQEEQAKINKERFSGMQAGQEEGTEKGQVKDKE